MPEKLNFKVSETLSQNYVPLASSLFYLEDSTKDAADFLGFVKKELHSEQDSIIRSLLNAELITKIGGKISLTDLGNEIAKKLHPDTY